jgi:diacylglycerol kinase (ATP)
MRASVIFGPGFDERDLRPFRSAPDIFWHFGVPDGPGGADVILLFGGDGTVHRHLAALLEIQIPLLVVPKGSGNDFVRGLGMNPRKALAAWRQFASGANNVRRVDVGVVKDIEAQKQHNFCTVAGVGLDGEVARRANRLPRWLRANGGYALTLVPLLFQFAAFPMKISAPESGCESSPNGFQPTILAAFANAPAYGGGMRIAPRARMEDGQLDICVIRDIGKFKLFCAFPTVYFGRHLKLREVEYSQAPCARLETEYPLDVYADGEWVCRTPIEVSLKRNALPVVVPSGDL